MNIRGVSAYKSIQQSLPVQRHEAPDARQDKQKVAATNDEDSRERLLKMLETKGRIIDIRI